MEEFLDECLQDYGLITDETFQITFKYSFLGPPLSQTLKAANAATEDDGNDYDGELDELEFKAKNLEEDKEEDEFLQDLPEAEPLWYLALSKDHRHLLAHPVITSFLFLKWRRIRPYFYINLFFFLSYVACLTSYLLLMGNKDLSLTVLRIVSLVFTSIIASREVFQAIISPRMYLCNLENIMEMVMLGISFYLCVGTFEYNQMIRNLSAAAVLLSWAEMFLMAGRHPVSSSHT